MSEFQFFIELTYQKKSPVVEYKLNGITMNIISNIMIEKIENFEKRKITCHGEDLKKNNILELSTTFNESNNYTDFIDIKEIIIDGHYMEMTMNHSSNFFPVISKEWIKKTLKNRIKTERDIETFLKKTKIESSGIWQFKFFTPLWEFVVLNLNK